jgi:phosphoesterase RecJ-like protein
MRQDRLARVNRQLQATLAELIPGHVKDPRVHKPTMLTVAEVRVTPDLRTARVYLSILGEDTQRQQALEAIRRAGGFLRGELGRRVRLRYTPQLQFELDETLDAAARIDQILGEIADDRPEERAGDPPRAVLEAVGRGRRFLVTAHPSPDGDAIGSMVAALHALVALGRDVVAFNPDPVPDRFRFLSGTERFRTELDGERPFDTTLVLDCADERMLPGGVDREALGQVVVIDHHKTAGSFGDVVWRDPSAAAVGVQLFKLFEELAVPASLEVAEALFCSVMSDTGSFRYQNTDPEAMRVAAALLERGVDPWHISSNLYEERPRCELELLGLVLQTLRVSDDGSAACLVVTEEMLAATGATPDMVDGFINYARGVRGVEVAILLRPGPRGMRVSLRSRGSVDVSLIAERFGGGGHHNAAGCTLSDDDTDRVRRDLFAAVERILST